MDSPNLKPTSKREHSKSGARKVANHLRREAKQRESVTSPKPPSKRSPRKSMPPAPVPSEPVKQPESSLFHNLKAWLKRLLRIGNK